MNLVPLYYSNYDISQCEMIIELISGELANLFCYTRQQKQNTLRNSKLCRWTTVMGVGNWCQYLQNHDGVMGLLPDTYHCVLRMHRECRERFPRHWLQMKPQVSHPGMHYGTCLTHVSWCMSGSLTRGGGENVPGIPSACATHNFTYLVRGPWHDNAFGIAGPLWGESTNHQ